MAARHHLPYIASAALSVALVAPCAIGAPAPAHASTLDDLTVSYQAATSDYRATVVDRIRNCSELVAVQNEMGIAASDLEESKDQLANTVVKLYKSERHRSDLVDFVLDGSSLLDAMSRFKDYTRFETSYRNQIQDVKQECADLADKADSIEKQKDAIEVRAAQAANTIQEVEAALLDADHSDGARYHQVQGNGSNCGATSFIVGVNILLHENRYTDNVKVWSGAGFQGDSTANLGFKSRTWLMAHGLADAIEVTTIPGDIHTTAQLKEELDEAHVVVISSGSGSVWQRADGTAAGLGTFPDGHWIVFYHERDGVFYANDSSVGAKKGAGCAFTEKQMQQWLDGRENHFAVSLAKKELGATVPYEVTASDVRFTGTTASGGWQAL